jgi:hypothetical protein
VAHSREGDGVGVVGRYFQSTSPLPIRACVPA